MNMNIICLVYAISMSVCGVVIGVLAAKISYSNVLLERYSNVTTQLVRALEHSTVNFNYVLTSIIVSTQISEFESLPEDFGIVCKLSENVCTISIGCPGAYVDIDYLTFRDNPKQAIIDAFQEWKHITSK